MKHIRLIIFFLMGCSVCIWIFSISPIPQDSQKTIASYPRVEIKDTELRTLKSKYVDQEYRINIFFPIDYHNEDKRYPAVYVLDAEYNFGCVAYIARRLIKNGDIPKILLIGIAYDTDYEDFYGKRFRDSTPESHIHGRNSGGVEKFTQFIEHELIPFIDRNYRIVPGDRTIVGHSITGFYGCYTLFRHPDLFNRYIIVSPSLWFSDGEIFEYEEEFASDRKDMKASVYLSVGGDESPRMKDGALRFNNTLSKRKYPHLKFNFSQVDGENHRSLFPFALSRGLRFVFLGSVS